MRRLFVMFFLLCATSVSVADGDVAQLHLLLSSANSLQSGFEQTVVDADGAVLQKSSGQISLQRPNKIRWQSTEPFNYLMISDGDTLWRYDADLDQLNTEPFDPSLAQAPAMILGASIEQLDSNFDVAISKNGIERSFILTPKEEGGNFSQLVLHFNQGKLIGMALVDTLEQRTDIKLIKPDYKPKFPAQHFTFQETDQGSS
ncbi:outer membrane lipoprotein chaperone LolA [Spongiibacter taiwanensis]|uniref:outer membrane lipoprotein chaperone LolA n=1 Tax=Spongiibacter taiwanensis TaxID=1748242 RepID=UPI002035CC2C|nr:outer membrane lipoprotein chaperone LolA [Spongiibacter taiwanensis]USA43444.1 outer membrane lipoprotein chaperone LolA [Spongiibacter taiwanensis]